MGVQTEPWNVIISDFDGAMTSRDSDDIPDGKSPVILNARVTGSHMRGAKGYSLIGTRNETPGSTTAKFTYIRNDGIEIMVTVRDDGATGTLQWYDQVNDEFYTLLAGLTTGKVMGFAEFNTSTTNQLIFCNGVQNVSVWTGATTRLTSALVGGETSISVVDTTNFPATGTIIYNGTEIAYSAKTATTFTVASAHASAGANDGIAQAVDDSTHSGITKGNILLSAKDRLWIAGQPGAPNALDYSDEGNAFTFTGGANRADSGTEDFFNIGGAITGIAEKGEEIIVLGQDGGDGFSFVYPTATTKAPKFREIFRSKGYGCLSFRSIVKINQEVYFANKNGMVSLGDLEGSDKVFTTSVTRDVLPTMQTYDFSEAVAEYYDRESILLVACKTDADFPGNDIVIGLEFYNDRNGVQSIGIVYFDWPVECIAIFEDRLYIGSSFEMNTFKAFDTYQNDGAPRSIRYATKRLNFKNPFQHKTAPLMSVRGMIKDGTDIDVLIEYNKGFKGSVSKKIRSDGLDEVTGVQKHYVSQQNLNDMGSFPMGVNPIGALREEVSELKEFVVYLDVGIDYDWHDIQALFSSETDGGTFLITHVGFAIESTGFSSQPHLTI